MAFCFEKTESVPNAIRRLGRERMKHALACLKTCDGADAIHCVRTDIKKTRAVLRLVRSRITKKKFRRLTTSLQKTASLLAAPRDAYIKPTTLRNLARPFKGRRAPRPLHSLRAALQRRFAEEMERFQNDKIANTVSTKLRRVTRELERLSVRGNGWKSLRRGLSTAYRKARRAHRKIVENPSPRNLHNWRKYTKDLWYQVRLLHPARPEQIDAISSDLRALGEYLGDDHDLFILRDEIDESLKRDGNARELVALVSMIERRQHKLQAAALALGARLYAEKPSIFCNRLGGYWQRWRG